jgi:pilus assembly protein Flp/PilA
MLSAIDGPGGRPRALIAFWFRISPGGGKDHQVGENSKQLRPELRTASKQVICRLSPVPSRAQFIRSEPMTKLIHFLHDESGATAIEYGLIAAGISVAIIAVVNTLGTKLNAAFTNVSNNIQ